MILKDIRSDLLSIVFTELEDVFYARQVPGLFKTLVDDVFFHHCIQELSHIRDKATGNDGAKERSKEIKDCVVHVIIPRLNPNAVVRCGMHEVLCQVVNDDSSLERSSEVS